MGFVNEAPAYRVDEPSCFGNGFYAQQGVCRHMLRYIEIKGIWVPIDFKSNRYLGLQVMDVAIDVLDRQRYNRNRRHDRCEMPFMDKVDCGACVHNHLECSFIHRH